MTPDQLDKLVASTSKLYGDIELRILRRIARQVSSDLDVPDWQMRKLAELRLVLRYVGSELDRISPELLRRVILRAYRDGAATALSELGRVPDEMQAYQASAALSRVTPLLDDVDALHGAIRWQVLRTTEDVYRSIVRQSVAATVLGAETYRTATQTALNQLADVGVTGFVDRAGREWALEGYADMAVRTGVHNASRQGHTDQLERIGHDLVMVTDHGGSCKRCAPWEGKVLSLTGADGGERVAATLEHARAEGLFHPRCRHRMKAYIPGVTRSSARVRREAAEYLAKRAHAGYTERKWERREAVAITPESKRLAKAKLRGHSLKEQDS